MHGTTIKTFVAYVPTTRFDLYKLISRKVPKKKGTQLQWIVWNTYVCTVETQICHKVF